MSIWSRAKHLGYRIAQETKEYPARLKEYGFKVAGVTFVDGIIPPGKHSIYIRTIEEYVNHFMEPIIERYHDWNSEKENITCAGKTPVWCCWWQGTEQMPELVRMCNKRLRQLLPDDEVELHFLTRGNYKEYVELPDYIIEKFQAGKMSITALSDVLRVALLAQYGGFWIDATVFISDYFPMEFVRSDFYAQRMFDPVKWKREACKGRWCGFLMGGKAGNIIFCLLRDAFFAWWRIHDSAIDYVILDYFLLAGYRRIPEIRKQIESVSDNNPDVFEMYKVLNEPYTPALVEQLTKRTNLHKLTYKMELKPYTEDGTLSLYGFLLNLVEQDGDK